MKRVICIFILVLAVAYVWFAVPLVDFKVVYHNGSDENFLYERQLRETECEDLVKTLNKYNAVYESDGRSVKMTLQLYFDKEMRWNYSSKSNLFN